MKRQALKQALLIQLIHVPLYILVGMLFLPDIKSLQGFDQVIYLVMTTLGHFTVFSFLFLVFTYAAGNFLTVKKTAIFAGTLNLLVIAGLFLDALVFSLYRFHINGFVFDMIVGGAATDIFRFSIVDFTKVTFIFLFLMLVEASLIRLSFWISARKENVTRSAITVFLVGFAMMTYAHIRHAVAFASYQSSIVSVSRNFPFYFPLTANKQIYGWGIVDFDKVRELSLTQDSANAGGDLLLPRNEIQFSPHEGQLPNILWIVVDSLRSDGLNKKSMPNAWNFSQNAERFIYHRSGSNGTRGGIFSLFYALPSLYWDSVFSQKGAPWISILQNKGYELGIFASAPLYSPEFDKTVFLDVKNLRVQTERNGKKANSGWQSDVWAVEDWTKFLDTRHQSQPFFGFLFFDAVHAKDHPPGRQPFLPAAEQATYVGLNNDSDPTEYLNLYKNSANFDDELIGNVLSDLENRHLLKNTIIVFTSDHGEEFNDNKQNYWGHNGNFSDAQLHIPLWIYWPGKGGRVFSHPTTHYDIVPTLLRDVFGMENPASDISFGKFLDDETTSQPWHIAGSPLNFAIIEPDQMMVKFATGHYEMYDRHMKPLPDNAFRPKVTAEALKKIRSYYKK